MPKRNAGDTAQQPGVLWGAAWSLLGAAVALWAFGPGIDARLRGLAARGWDPAQAPLPLLRDTIALGLRALLLLCGTVLGCALAGGALRRRLLRGAAAPVPRWVRRELPLLFGLALCAALLPLWLGLFSATGPLLFERVLRLSKLLLAGSVLVAAALGAVEIYVERRPGGRP